MKTSQAKQIEARSVIAGGLYAEFPDTVLHAQLCIALAKKDGRSIPQALRGFALARLPVIRNPSLRASLEVMSRTLFPESELSRIKGCLVKMETAMKRELRNWDVTGEVSQ